MAVRTDAPALWCGTHWVTFSVIMCLFVSLIGVGCRRYSPAESLSPKKQDISTLLERVCSDNSQQQDQAVEVLARLQKEGVDVVPELLRLFKEAQDSCDDNRIRQATKALAVVGAYRLDSIIEYANQVDLDKRANIIFVLRKIGNNQAIPFLIACLKSNNPEVRRCALFAIDEIPDERAFEPVLGLLDDEDEDIRTSAVASLGAISDSRALAPLSRIYSQKPTGNFLGVLIEALGTLHAHEYTEDFIKLDRSLPVSDYLHEATADALGDLADVRALALLSERILDKSLDSNERLRYAIALNKIPDTRKSEAASRVWKDNSERNVRLRTYAALIVANSSSQDSLEAATWVLERGNVAEKGEVVRLLGSRLYRNKTAILRLLELAAKDSNEYVENAAKYEMSRFEYN